MYHMIHIFLVIMIILNVLYENIIFLSVVFFLLSGLIGYARLKEKSHSKNEIYVGFILGFLLEILLFLKVF